MLRSSKLHAPWKLFWALQSYRWRDIDQDSLLQALDPRRRITNPPDLRSHSKDSRDLRGNEKEYAKQLLLPGVAIAFSCSWQLVWIYIDHIAHTHCFFMNGSHQKHVARREVCRSYVSYPSLLVWVEPVSIDFISIPSFFGESVPVTVLSLSVATFLTLFRDIIVCI